MHSRGSGNDDTPYVLGVDAGGTHTRVGCFALDGTMLGRATGRCGTLLHDRDAAAHVSETVHQAVRSARLELGDARALVSGSSGMSLPGNRPGGAITNEMLEELYDLPGLTCPRQVVNDAVIAHRGALGGLPGVIVVAGTGSMILAITEDGTQVGSGQFEHYAGGARHLVFEAVHRVLTRADSDPLVPALLEHWGVDSVPELRRVLLVRAADDYDDLKRRYGTFAPRVTALAGRSRLADISLDALARKTAMGIQLLAPLAAARPVPVSGTGSLALDPAFSQHLRAALDDGVRDGSTPVRWADPRLSPLGGAALMALEMVGVGPAPSVLAHLSAI